MDDELTNLIKARLGELDGQIGALTMALQGLILAQPDPHYAAISANARIEKYLASALASAAPDDYVDGVHQQQRELFPKPEAL